MKRDLLYVAVLALSLTMMSCSQIDDGADSHTFRLFWPKSGGDYGFKDVEVKTLTNVKALRGEDTRVYVNPKVSNENVSGESPKARFVRGNDGVLIPANVMSHQAIATYAHIERLKKIAIAAGLDKGKSSPRIIFFHNNLRKQDGTKSKNNAHHIASIDAVSIVPFTGKGKVPTGLNAGVIAHEHFHGIFAALAGTDRFTSVQDEFDYSFGLSGLFDPGSILPEEEIEINQSRERSLDYKVMIRELYNKVIVGALNEGLADFWGFLYTGDPNFISRSFSKQSAYRKLDADSALASRKNIEEILRREGSAAVKDLYYEVGTQYARYLYDLYLLVKEGESLSGASGLLSNALNLGDATSASKVKLKQNDEEIRKKFQRVVLEITRELGHEFDLVARNIEQLNQSGPVSESELRLSSDLLSKIIISRDLESNVPSRALCRKIIRRGVLHLRENPTLMTKCGCEPRNRNTIACDGEVE